MDNSRIWNNIKGLMDFNTPICCIRDFNAIADIKEKHEGSCTLNANKCVV
jgi:hypothetical protein